MKIAVVLLLLAGTCTLLYRRDNQGRPTQDAPKNRPVPIPDSALDPATLQEVGSAYEQTVKPLLKRACFDCHSSQTEFPWYHRLPVVAGYLDDHVREAREHLDLEGGFPFKNKRPIVSRIRSIGGSVKRGSMPLWNYKLMHPAARLSDEEKKVITDWADSSFQKLSATARP